MNNSVENVSGPMCIQLLLRKLDTSHEKDKVKCLQQLGKLVFQNPKLREEFLQLGGINIMLDYLNHNNPAIIGSAFHVLGFSFGENVKRKREICTENVFNVLKKHLNGNSCFLTKCALFLTAMTVEGNALGQKIVRESGCLYYLVKIFYNNLRPTLNMVTEEELTYWTFICPALKVCVENPHNLLNQHQASLIIPRAIAFLENWFQMLSDQHLAEKTELLVSVLVAVILENETNKLGFTAYSGIRWIIRGLQVLAGGQSMPKNIDTLRDKLVALLTVAVEKNPSNCQEATTYGAVPLLLFVLVHAKDKYKLRPLLALTQLVHNCSKSKDEFIQENGISFVVKATVNFEAYPDTTLAAKRLLKYCAADTEKLTTNPRDAKKHINEMNSRMPCFSQSDDTNDAVNISNNAEQHKICAPKSSCSSEKTLQQDKITDSICSVTSKHGKIRRNLLCTNCTKCSSVTMNCNHLSEIRERFPALHLSGTETENSCTKNLQDVLYRQEKANYNTISTLSKDRIFKMQPSCSVNVNDSLETKNKSLHKESHWENSTTTYGKGNCMPLTNDFRSPLHLFDSNSNAQEIFKASKNNSVTTINNLASSETKNVSNSAIKIARKTGGQYTEPKKYSSITTVNKTIDKAQGTSPSESNSSFSLSTETQEFVTQNIQRTKLEFDTIKQHGFKNKRENAENGLNHILDKNQHHSLVHHQKQFFLRKNEVNSNKASRTFQSDTEICFKKPRRAISSLKHQAKECKERNEQDGKFQWNIAPNNFSVKRKYTETPETISKCQCCYSETSTQRSNDHDFANETKRFRKCLSDTEANCLNRSNLTGENKSQNLTREMPSKLYSQLEDSNTESVVSNTIKRKIKCHNKNKVISLNNALVQMQSESQSEKVQRYLNSCSNAIQEFDVEENRNYSENALSKPMAYMIIPISTNAQSVHLSRPNSPQRNLKDVHMSLQMCNENKNIAFDKGSKEHLNAVQECDVQSIESVLSNGIEMEHTEKDFSRSQNINGSTEEGGSFSAPTQTANAQENITGCETESINSAETEKGVDKDISFEETIAAAEKKVSQVSHEIYSAIQKYTKDRSIVEKLLKNFSFTDKEYMSNCMPASSLVQQSPESVEWFTPQENTLPETKLTDQIKEKGSIHPQAIHTLHDGSDGCSVGMTPAFTCSFGASQQYFSEPIQTPLSHHKQKGILCKQLFPAVSNEKISSTTDKGLKYIFPERFQRSCSENNISTAFCQTSAIDHKEYESEKRKDIQCEKMTETEQNLTISEDEYSVLEVGKGEEEEFFTSSEYTCPSKSGKLLRRKHNKTKPYRLLKYTDEELQNLISGVQKYGRDFKAIRRAYRFHKKRSAKDLYLKWRLYCLKRDSLEK